jgi:putative ABC transport system permease protein
MLFLEIVRVAFGALVANKVRAMLAMLGIIIGVAAVTAVLAMGEGAKRVVLQAITSEEKSQLTLLAHRASAGGYWSGYVFTDSECRALRNETTYCKAFLPHFPGTRMVQFRSRRASVWIAGVESPFFEATYSRVAAGRFLTEGDDASRRSVTVLGAGVATNLGFSSYMVGQSIRIGENDFEVVGVLELTGNAGWHGYDDSVMMPPKTVSYCGLGNDWEADPFSPHWLDVWITSPEHVINAAEEIDRILRRARRITPNAKTVYSIKPSLDINALRQKTTETFASLLTGISAVSLLVGGIGVMNIMLVSVTERTREIGLRIAVGATRTAVLMQFVSEAIVLCLFGGGAGAALGWYVARIMSQTAGWQTVVTSASLVLALGVSIVVGMVSGIYPALRAARFDPVEALRYE